jgi:hypothetical protein
VDVLNRFSFSNRFAKEMVQETCSQTGFAPRGINQTGLKQRFPIMSISNRFAQPNQFKIIELAQCCGLDQISANLIRQHGGVGSAGLP